MDMRYVKGRRLNLVSVGWENHVLQVEFKGGRRYQYGGVPSDVIDKLLRSPFPDSLFAKIVRGKYPSQRIDTPPSKPAPVIDDYELPF